MWMNYVPKHSRDHADSEYISNVWVDRKWAEFFGNKLTNKYTNTQLYVIVQSTEALKTDLLADCITIKIYFWSYLRN